MMTVHTIFHKTPYDIIGHIIDFIDEDKHYKKAEHQEKMQSVFNDLENMSNIFGINCNDHLLIPAHFAKVCWGQK